MGVNAGVMEAISVRMGCVCFKRQMDREAMMRENCGRLMKYLEESEGTDHTLLKERRVKLEKLVNEWETRRDDPWVITMRMG